MPLIIPKTLPAYDALYTKISSSCIVSAPLPSTSARWRS